LSENTGNKIAPLLTAFNALHLCFLHFLGVPDEMVQEVISWASLTRNIWETDTRLINGREPWLDFVSFVVSRENTLPFVCLVENEVGLKGD